MPSTPIPLVIPFREELKDPLGLEFENLTSAVNANFSSPTNPRDVALFYSDYLPDIEQDELQQLVAAINAGFQAVKNSTVASPIALRHRGEIRDKAVQDELEYFVVGVNMGLAALYP